MRVLIKTKGWLLWRITRNPKGKSIEIRSKDLIFHLVVALLEAGSASCSLSLENPHVAVLGNVLHFYFPMGT